MDKGFKGTEDEYKEWRKKRNEANRKYYSKPEVREKKKAYSKQYRVENKEKISEYGKRHNQLPHVQKRLKQWREKNKEHLREYRSKEENRIKKRIADKKYRTKKRQDPEYVKKEIERSRKFRENNPENVKNWKRKYYQSEKGKINSTYHNHRRLSLIKKSETDLSNEKIRTMLRKYKSCVYCQSTSKLEIDHIIPLDKGGKCTRVNLVRACAKCNRSKSGKDVIKWCKEQGIEVPNLIIKRLEIMKIK